MTSLVNKKTLIIVSLSIILLVILGILIGLKSSPADKSTQNNTSTTDRVNSNITPTNSLTTYYSPSYTLSYPNTWSKNETALTNDGGTLVTFQPQPVSFGQYAKISIEVLKTQTTSISTITHIFTTLHYTQTRSAVAGVDALKYAAVIPTQNGNLHSIAYVFQQNEKIYSLKLEYIQADTNTQIEGQFYQLLNSFSLQ